MMTKVEKDILHILKKNSRCSTSELAKMVGLSEDKVVNLISKFEEDGVIVQYTTIPKV